MEVLPITCYAFPRIAPSHGVIMSFGSSRLDTTTVYIIDPDPISQKALHVLLSSLGACVHVFSDAEAFLDRFLSIDHDRGCLITEVDLPGMTGIDLLVQLRERNIKLPAVILTGHGDVPTAVIAIKTGAVDFIEKPFIERALVSRVFSIVQSPD